MAGEDSDESNQANTDTAGSNKPKALTIHPILKGFGPARDRLRDEIPQKLLMKTFFPLFSSATITRLRKSDTEYASSNFSKTIQERLIWFFDQPRYRSLYWLLADQIGQDENDLAHLLKNYRGEYRYFRFASLSGDEKNLTYVSGRIVIERDADGDPSFRHWSEDYGVTKPVAEHIGYVFKQEQRLFFAGRKVGVMRLGIARTFDSDKAKDALHGIVVSVRTSQRDPYGARFIMVHVDNEQLIETLDPKSPGSKQAFFNLSKGRYAYYMLIH